MLVRRKAWVSVPALRTPSELYSSTESAEKMFREGIQVYPSGDCPNQSARIPGSTSCWLLADSCSTRCLPSPTWRHIALSTNCIGTPCTKYRILASSPRAKYLRSQVLQSFIFIFPCYGSCLILEAPLWVLSIEVWSLQSLCHKTLSLFHMQVCGSVSSCAPLVNSAKFDPIYWLITHKKEY